MLRWIQKTEPDDQCLWYRDTHGLGVEHPGYATLLEYHYQQKITPELLALDQQLYREDADPDRSEWVMVDSHGKPPAYESLPVLPFPPIPAQFN